LPASALKCQNCGGPVERDSPLPPAPPAGMSAPGNVANVEDPFPWESVMRAGTVLVVAHLMRMDPPKGK
jgi:hypothetical protein